MVDTPNIRERDPASANPKPKQITQLKVAEKREDGTVVLELEDGRMIVAKLKDGMDKPHKGAMVNITAPSFLEDGLPENPEIVSLA